MNRLLKHLGIILFSGTMLTLIAMQTYLSEHTAVRHNNYILQSRKRTEQFATVKALSRNYEEIFATTDVHDVLYTVAKKLSESKEESSQVTEGKNEDTESAGNIIDKQKLNNTGLRTTAAPTTQNEIRVSYDNHIVPEEHEASDYCPEFPKSLIGKLNVNASYEPSEDEAQAAGGVISDGCFHPKWCRPTQSVAIIIPYKDRMRHLITLMYHLHPILQRQAIHYCVFVAEQYDNGAFNKARIMNAAFKEITVNHPIKFDCVIFHDVDMLLEDDRNLHSCTKMPKHLSPAIDKFNYTLDYGTKFGGVTAISVENYKLANGHSNNFWGWGGEDNDMEVRISHSNLTINITNPHYGRYKMIPHEHPWWFSPLYGVGSYLQSKKHWSKRKVDSSGLSDIRYSLRFTTYNKLWTKLTLDIRTILIEKASVRFRGYANVGTLDFVSPSFATEQRYSDIANGQENPPGDDACTYVKFIDKTVNKTLGLQKKEKIRYGRMYKILEQAERMCDQMHTSCGSIVEEYPGMYSLRATGYVHENYLKYRSGMVKQTEVVETHKTRSVHVKSCPGSTSYLGYFKNSIVMPGDAKSGPSPAYSVQFTMRLFYDINTTLYYTSDVMTAHKATIQDQIDAGVIESSPWNTLGNVYSGRVKLLNISDPADIRKVLPKEFTSVNDVVKNGGGIVVVETPLSGLLRHPGCYVCRSTLTNENGVALMQWRWWFELRARSKEIEDTMLEAQLEKARVASIDFSDTVEKRRQMWLSYHEKLKSMGNNNKPGLPAHILKMMENIQKQQGMPDPN